MAIVKITGFISEENNHALEEYADKHSKKKMPLIGEIISEFLENENQEEDTMPKKPETKAPKSTKKK